MDDKKDTPKEEKKIVQPKSIRQIVEEAHNPVKETPKEEPKNEKLEEDVVAKKKERVKQKEEEQGKQTEEVVKKTAEETASKVMEETKKTFQEQIDKILQKPIDEQQKQKEADELVASWDKEKRLPKDYKELITETQRIAEVKAQRTFEELQTKRDAEIKAQQEKEQAEKTAKEEASKKEAEENQARVNRAVQDDLDKLYDIKELAKPKDIKEIDNPNTTDQDAQAVQKFFNFAIKSVNEHKTKGEVIPSVWRIYHDEYKSFLTEHPLAKTGEVAGAAAPVAGNSSTPSSEPSKDKYVWARDHNKSIGQLANDIFGRFRGK